LEKERLEREKLEYKVETVVIEEDPIEKYVSEDPTVEHEHDHDH